MSMTIAGTTAREFWALDWRLIGLPERPSLIAAMQLHRFALTVSRALKYPRKTLLNPADLISELVYSVTYL